jgi:hypothetical protein
LKKLEDIDDDDDLPQFTGRQPVYTFVIPTHPGRYVLTGLLPYYGEAFCRRLESAWKRATIFKAGSSMKTLFKDVRRAFLWLAVRGATGVNSVEARCYSALRDGQTELSVADWERFIGRISAAILDRSDTSFVNGKVRNKKIESLRAGLRLLSDVQLIPHCDPGGRNPGKETEQVPCLATLAYRSGRFSPAGQSLEEGAQAFIAKNVEMLEALRAVFWEDLSDNLAKFDAGRAMVADTALPSIAVLEAALCAQSGSKICVSDLKEALNISDAEYFSCAVRYADALISGYLPKANIRRRQNFFAAVGGPAKVSPFVGPVPDGLLATYMILMIDSGANSQPLDDLAASPIASKQRRGRVALATLSSLKGRAQNKPKSWKLVDELISVPTKSTTTRPSAVYIIKEWQRLSSVFRRDDYPATKSRFWVWKSPKDWKIRTGLQQIAVDWLPEFLKRNRDNPSFGGLRITRPNIRKAVANSRGGDADFAYEVAAALMGHESPEMPFNYMTEGALKALLASKIREFQDAWQATSALTIEGAARAIGVADLDFRRSAQLGLSSGLEFAALSETNEDDKPAGIELLLEGMDRLIVTPSILRKVETARRALWGQFESVGRSNPERFIRIWMPWLAIIQGYCDRLAHSRFKKQFRDAVAEVEAALASGHLRLPYLW